MTALARSTNLFKGLIILIWIFMAFLLVKKIHLIPALTLAPEEELSDSESWMSVYFKGQKIGYTEFTLSRTNDGYNINQNAYLRMKLMGDYQELRTLTSAVVDDVMLLRSFNFYMSAGPVRYQISGRVKGSEIELVSSTGGRVTESSLALDEVPRLASGLIPFVTRQGLTVDQQFKVPIFDPSTLSMKSVTVTVEDREKLVIDGRTIDTFRLRENFRDTQTYAWVDSAGRIVKEDGLLGFSMVQATEEKAKEGLAGRADVADLVESTSAPITPLLEMDPRMVDFLKVKIKGIDPEGFELSGGRQTFADGVLTVTRETADPADEIKLPVRDPAVREFLKPTTFIQSRHPKITRQAHEIIQGERSPLKIIRLVTAWVSENLEKRPTMSVPSATDVLRTKVGDCNEHAVLAAAPAAGFRRAGPGWWWGSWPTAVDFTIMPG